MAGETSNYVAILRTTRLMIELPPFAASLRTRRSSELHSACRTARAESDVGGLTAMFAKILDDDPAYDF